MRGSPAAVGLHRRGRARPDGWLRLDPAVKPILPPPRPPAAASPPLHPLSLFRATAASPPPSHSSPSRSSLVVVPYPALVVPMGEEGRRGLQGWWRCRVDRRCRGGARCQGEAVVREKKQRVQRPRRGGLEGSWRMSCSCTAARPPLPLLLRASTGSQLSFRTGVGWRSS